jgi:outer membrane protein assembly factor BamA
MGKTELSFTKFYGFGNDTKKSDRLEDRNFYRVDHELLYIESRLEYPALENYKIWLGYTYRFSQIYVEENSLLENIQPTGIEDWSYMGLSSGLEYDNRDHQTAPLSGFYLNFCNIHFPQWLDNDNAYSKTRLDMRAYLKSEIFTTSSLALRFYGAKLWGRYPFFDAAFLGGSDNLRGYNRERFAGNAALFGSAEWRVYLFPYDLIVPAQFGVSVFTDFGRVYYPGEQSNKVHQSYGGGLWTYFTERQYLGNLSIAKSEEELAFYLSLGFSF